MNTCGGRGRFQVFICVRGPAMQTSVEACLGWWLLDCSEGGFGNAASIVSAPTFSSLEGAFIVSVKDQCAAMFSKLQREKTMKSVAGLPWRKHPQKYYKEPRNRCTSFPVSVFQEKTCKAKKDALYFSEVSSTSIQKSRVCWVAVGEMFIDWRYMFCPRGEVHFYQQGRRRCWKISSN